ncbi:MAG TPA: proprotein convertase P-domain-containing protein, partial [Gemmataceae bacterium]|nr:proprotein convertase P-domain-containing protein [Gemmataceae bacterium]
PGAPIFVSAFGGDDLPGITTTDLVGTAGDNKNASPGGDYNSDFGGTSAAAPEVSGVVALMLQVNPGLTWRDVKHILADTAVKNDPTDPGWVRNGAGHWVNHKYGFGQVDAAAAVRAAAGWRNVGAEQVVAPDAVAVGRTIPDNNGGTGVTSPVTIDALIRVETVEVMFNASTTRRGDLRVVLTSPDGTQSVLAEPHADTGANYPVWTFTSTHHWDEISRGTWTLRVTDEQGGTVGTFNSWKLSLYGTAVTDEHYVTLAAGAVASGRDFGDRPLPGARLTVAQLPAQGGAQRLVFGFDRDLAAGVVSADDLEVFNLTTGEAVAADATQVAYNPATRTATWTFPGLFRGILSNGHYAARLKADQLTVPGGGMLDANGDGMGGDDFTFRFTFLQGDLNGDRVVNATDSDALVRNLNKAPATWNQGDLNYDGKVGFTDYQIMQLTFRKSLPPPPPDPGGSVIYPEESQPVWTVAAAPALATTTTAGTTTTTTPAVGATTAASSVGVAAKAKAGGARPVPVAPPAPVFGVRPVTRRDVDLLDSPPLRI